MVGAAAAVGLSAILPLALLLAGNVSVAIRRILSLNRMFYEEVLMDGTLTAFIAFS